MLASANNQPNVLAYASRAINGQGSWNYCASFAIKVNIASGELHGPRVMAYDTSAASHDLCGLRGEQGAARRQHRARMASRRDPSHCNRVSDASVRQLIDDIVSTQ